MSGMRYWTIWAALLAVGLPAAVRAQAPERPGIPANLRQELLKRFDENGNGQLDPAEQTKARAQFSANRGAGNDGAREAMLKRFDANGNGQLEPAELAKAREAMQGRGNPGSPLAGLDREALLKRFDANGDGQIDATEREKAREAFERLRGAQGSMPGMPGGAAPERPSRLNTSALLTKFDANKNGRLDPEERRAASQELRKRRQN